MSAERTGPVAIVTGATDGIGRALVDGLLNAGYAVVGVGLDDPWADQLEQDRQGSELVVIRGDVADPELARRAVDSAVSTWGRLDALCNLAAVRPLGTIVDTGLEAWDQAFAVNVRGVYLFCRTALEVMVPRGRGAIINFGSPSGHGGEGHIAYCASKGAIQAMTLSLAMDHVRDGIRVNLVVPGSTRTGMNRGRDPKFDEAIARRWSVTGDINQPFDVAAFVLFLLSDQSPNVSGGIFHIGVVAGEPVRRIDI